MHVIHVMLLNVYFSKSTQTSSSTHTLLIHNVIRQTPHLASRPQTSAWTLLTPSTSSSTTLLNAAATPAATLQWKIRLKAEAHRLVPTLQPLAIPPRRYQRHRQRQIP